MTHAGSAGVPESIAAVPHPQSCYMGWVGSGVGLQEGPTRTATLTPNSGLQILAIVK